jgi:ABC-type multidrug transport system ATPase subunit
MPQGQGHALELLHVSKTYAGDVTALEAFEMSVPRACLVGLLGPNGSGKSTLLRLCAGALRPSSGSIRALGFEPGRASAADRGRIGFADQDVALDPEMTGMETFELLAALYRLDRTRKQRELTALSDLFGLGPLLRRRVASYSGGMRRRLHVALSLLPEAELLLLDEPFVGLDAETRARLWSSLAERAKAGTSVLVATHELFDAGVHCDAVAVMSRGRLLTYGRPRELMERHAGPGATRASLENAYLQLTGEAE